MLITFSQKILVYISSIISLVQGIAWTVLSATCIIVYYVHPKIASNFNNIPYHKVLDILLFRYYLQKNTVDPWRIIRAKDFIILMWFYLFISLIWIAAAIYQTYIMYYKRTNQYKGMVLWSVVTMSVSVIDLVATSMLLRDYTLCLHIVCRNMTGIIMAIISRGFVLWFINVILGVWELVVGIQIMVYNQATDTFLNRRFLPKPKLIRQPSRAERTDFYSSRPPTSAAQTNPLSNPLNLDPNRLSTQPNTSNGAQNHFAYPLPGSQNVRPFEPTPGPSGLHPGQNRLPLRPNGHRLMQ